METPSAALLPSPASLGDFPLPTQPPSEPSRSVSGAPGLPKWLAQPQARLGQFIHYANTVYDLFKRLGSLRDQRRRPQIPTADVVRSLFFTAALRLPSLNALEGELKNAPFQRLLGRRVTPDIKAFSADTVARVLDGLDLDALRSMLHGVVHKAERNKAFREGIHGAWRAVALDGWEPFSSYHRHCDHCLTRMVRKGKDGDEYRVPQYYHRFVFALLLGPGAEVVLDLEPLRPADLRRQAGENVDRHEGEQTAALRLIDRLHQEYGRFIDLFVLDALYANGPLMTRLTKHRYGAIITLKKETDEPLKDARVIMEGQPPSKVWQELHRNERIEAWDVDDIETLDTFKGKIRVVRAEVTTTYTKKNRIEKKTRTWCAAVIGERARRLPVRAVHQLHRSRWHIENTAFNQWTQQCHLTHVFRHTPGAVMAVMLLWSLVFTVMQLFVYRRLRRARPPKDPCDTIRAIVTQMASELARLRAPLPWHLLFDTS